MSPHGLPDSLGGEFYEYQADRAEARLQHERDLRHVLRDVTPLTRGRAA